MASISSKTWGATAHRPRRGRNKTLPRERHTLFSTGWSDVQLRFETHETLKTKRRRQFLYDTRTGEFAAILIHAQRIRGAATPGRVPLPDKVAISMLHSLIKRKLIP